MHTRAYGKKALAGSDNNKSARLTEQNILARTDMD